MDYQSTDSESINACFSDEFLHKGRIELLTIWGYAEYFNLELLPESNLIALYGSAHDKREKELANSLANEISWPWFCSENEPL